MYILGFSNKIHYQINMAFKKFHSHVWIELLLFTIKYEGGLKSCQWDNWWSHFGLGSVTC